MGEGEGEIHRRNAKERAGKEREGSALGKRCAMWRLLRGSGAILCTSLGAPGNYCAFI